MLLGVLASTIVAWFSRKREFRADIGGAKLAGTSAMISALERLKRSQESHLEGSMMAFGINTTPLEIRFLFLKSFRITILKNWFILTENTIGFEIIRALRN